MDEIKDKATLTRGEYEKLREDYRERFGEQTFCDNCNFRITDEQGYIFDWFIKKLTR